MTAEFVKSQGLVGARDAMEVVASAFCGGWLWMTGREMGRATDRKWIVELQADSWEGWLELDVTGDVSKAAGGELEMEVGVGVRVAEHE